MTLLGIATVDDCDFFPGWLPWATAIFLFGLAVGVAALVICHIREHRKELLARKDVLPRREEERLGE
jgi:hypothetical protein